MRKLVTLTELRAALSSNRLSSFSDAQKYFQPKELSEVIWQMATGKPAQTATPKAGGKLVQVAELLESQPWLSRQDVESRVRCQVPKDTYNRAQVYIGGVNTFQKSLVASYRSAVEKLLRKGVTFEEIGAEDIKRVAPGVEGCRYHAVIMASPMFKSSLQVSATPTDSAPKKDIVASAPVAEVHKVVAMLPIPDGCFVEIQVNNDGSKVAVVKKKIG